MSATAHIRIAYLISQYPAINHTFILREVRRLRASGIELHVISISSSDRPLEQLAPDEREEAAATYYVKSLGALKALEINLATFATRPISYVNGLLYALRLGGFDAKRTFSRLLYFAEAIMIGRWMERHQLSHVHIHFSSTVGLLVKRVFPVTMSLTVHGPVEFIDPAGSHLAEKVAASSFICAISNYARAKLMQASDSLHWEKIEVAPLGVDPQIFAPREFTENSAPFEVICVGRLAPVKAQHILVKAIGRLVAEGRDVRLRLVGDGPDRAGLEQSVAARGLAKHVIFEGWLNQERVQALYRQADAFALASFAEGVPVVLMEAMAMQIPCVATMIAGVPELIRNGVDGLLVAPSDDEELAGALRTLMDDASLCRRLGEAGRQRVIARYDLERNTEHLAKIFQRRITPAAASAAAQQQETNTRQPTTTRNQRLHESSNAAANSTDV